MRDLLQKKIDLKTKPLGSLGLLEDLALQIGLIQDTLNPKLVNPHLLLFAGDHGIAKEGVSAYPADVTQQMVNNFLEGGAAINVFCKQNNIKTKVIDAGVNHTFSNTKDLVNCKVGFGTKSFLREKAMSLEELELCFDLAEKEIDFVHKQDCNIIGFGEMGIGNTSSASMLMHYFTGIPLEECVGRGTGVNDEQWLKKLDILTKSAHFHGEITDSYEILRTFGGFEVNQICGAMLAAYKRNMIILVDGFIASAAFLAAYNLEKNILKNAIFCHNSNEVGHTKMLQSLNVKPILDLNMRVGEGTGCALAYPIVQAAVNFLNEMASFDSAGISNKE